MWMPTDAVGLAAPLSDTSSLDNLSSPEKNCLQMVAEGCPLHQVGDDMELSPHDVEALLSAAETKLGASNRLHAVSIALRKGAISF